MSGEHKLNRARREVRALQSASEPAPAPSWHSHGARPLGLVKCRPPVPAPDHDPEYDPHDGSYSDGCEAFDADA